MLGNRIKQLREEFNMSQETLSINLGVSPSTIGMYETNKRQPNYDILNKMAEIFSVSVDYLLGNSNIRTPAKTNYDEELSKIGLSIKDIKKIDDETKKEIKNFIEYIKGKNGKK